MSRCILAEPEEAAMGVDAQEMDLSAGVGGDEPEVLEVYCLCKTTEHCCGCSEGERDSHHC